MVEMREVKCFISIPKSKLPRDLTIVKADGSRIYTEDGRVFLDFTGGHHVMLLGYGFKPLQEASISQMGELDYCAHLGIAKIQNEFAKAIAELASEFMDDPLVSFSNSASEATEFIIQMVRTATCRHWIGACTGAYHGGTTGALSLTFDDPRFKTRIGPMLPNCLTFPYPYHRGHEPRTCKAYKETIDFIFSTQVAPSDLAALFIEPVQGHGGVRVPCPHCLSYLARTCQGNKAVLVVDETITGLGRTGKMFGVQNFDVSPDIIYLGKAVGGGIPLGVIVSDENILSGAEARNTTCSGNVLACARGLKLLNYIRNEDLPSRARGLGERTLKWMREWCEHFEFLSEARGLGLILGLEFNEKSAPLVDDVMKKCFSEGLLLSSAGIMSNVIEITPPLNIEEETLKEGLNILEDILKSLPNQI